MGAAPVLTILKDGETIKSQPLEGEALLGRAEGCVIRLEDRAISRQHAVLRPVSGGVQIEKKSEFAPISVNGSECTSALVKEGDVVAIGPYLLKLSMGAAAVTPPLPSAPLQQPDASAASQPLQLMPESSSVSVPSLDPGEAPEPAESPGAGADEAAGSPQADAGSGDEALVTPEFSLEAQAPEGSDPVDLGEIQIDEDAKTKMVPAAKVSAKLVLPPGMANVAELDMDKDEVSIGRGKDCDLVLEDKKASRKHAIIRREGVSFTIRDLGSANGTYVNGSKVQEQALSGDDIIRIGNAEFRFLVLSSDYVRNQDHFMPVPQEPDAPVDFGAGEPGAVSAPAGGIPPASGQFAGMPGASADGTGGISGLAGIGGVTVKKQSLYQKYRALPPRRKAIWTAVIIAALYFAFFDDEAPKVHHKPGAVVAAAHKGVATFDSLTPDQKKFVIAQHDLAFDYYRNHEYDKAIFEIEKIFTLIPDYKDSREIERYAKEGKHKLEALQEEKHKEEEEAKLKLRIAELVDDAKTLMDQKKYDKVGDLFSQILSLDPDNQQVADWRKQVDAYNEQKRIEEEQKEVQEQINARAWDLYKEGVSLKSHKKYADAITAFRRVAQIGATDKGAERAAAAGIREIQTIIADMRDPVLADAKQAEDAQDYAKAYKLYLKATEIDPSYPAGYAGIDRVRGVLHERAKALYIQAVLAESYTDFDTAKKDYQQCLDVAPEDDIYHDRARRKLSELFNPSAPVAGDGSGNAPDGGGDAGGNGGGGPQ